MLSKQIPLGIYEKRSRWGVLAERLQLAKR